MSGPVTPAKAQPLHVQLRAALELAVSERQPVAAYLLGTPDEGGVFFALTDLEKRLRCIYHNEEGPK